MKLAGFRVRRVGCDAISDHRQVRLLMKNGMVYKK